MNWQLLTHKLSEVLWFALWIRRLNYPCRRSGLGAVNCRLSTIVAEASNSCGRTHPHRGGGANPGVKGTSGIRAAVARGELVPFGRGARGRLFFTREALM